MEITNLVTGTIDEIVDSIECAVNTIVVRRAIYRRKDFCSVRKYNVPVLKTKNMKLKAYIEEALSRLRYYLTIYPISTFVVAIMDYNTMNVLERWQFIINVDDPQRPKAAQPHIRRQKQLLSMLKYIDITAECLKKPETPCTFKMILNPKGTAEPMIYGDDDDDA